MRRWRRWLRHWRNERKDITKKIFSVYVALDRLMILLCVAFFRNNVPLAEMVLRIITGKNDLQLVSCETQATELKRVTGAKSILLDAYGTDSMGKKYDIEVQRADIGADPHRARYHSSMMDIENLDAGEDFSSLPDTYVIFITENDYFGENQPLYPVQNIITTTGKPFNDGTHIIYVNGEYRRGF